MVDKQEKPLIFERFSFCYKIEKALSFQGFLREAPDRIRTGDLRITSASLYLLSHGSIDCIQQQKLLYLMVEKK